MKSKISMFLVILLFLITAGCGNQSGNQVQQTNEQTQAESEKSSYKIGVMTGTVSQGEEEYRAAEKVAQKYGDMIVFQTYPDNFMQEQETTIANMMSIASDPEVKAIVMVQAVPGACAAIDKVKEMRPDMLIIAGVPGEDPAQIASRADIVLAADELQMGETIIKQAQRMGAKTFVHYSFPRHMSYELLSQRRELFKKTCSELGMEFVDATAPDPLSEAGVPGAQQFILEDVPRKIAEYGKETAFFSTNCSMQEPLIKATLEHGAIFPQQCCPSPYHGYPGALGIEIPEDKKGDVAYVTEQIKEKIAEKGGTGRFSTWPVPVNMMFVEGAVEYARGYCDGQISGVDKDALRKIFSDIAGMEIKMSTLQGYDNYFLVISDYITF